MFGFEKKDLANIKSDELKEFRKAAKIYLGYSEDEITAIVRQRALFEIVEPSRGAGDGKNLQERSVRGAARKHV